MNFNRDGAWLNYGVICIVNRRIYIHTDGRSRSRKEKRREEKRREEKRRKENRFQSTSPV